MIGDTGELPQEFMRIYTQPDDEENDKSSRLTLSRGSGKLYTAEILEDGSWNGSFTEEELHSAFYVIQPEWLTGDN